MTRTAAPAFAEIAAISNFTFLRGASHPAELVERAAALGYRGLAITDVNSLAGVVRAHQAAKAVGLPLAIGARLLLSTGTEPPEDPPLEVLTYATDRASYGRLCRLLTLGKRRAAKGECELSLHDLLEHEAGLLAVLVPSAQINDTFLDAARGLSDAMGPARLSLAMSCSYGAEGRDHLDRLAALGVHLRLPLAATNDAAYHVAERKPLHDVLTCIREGCTLDTAGFRLEPNAERHLKSPGEIQRLFAVCPQAIARSLAIIEQASQFSLDELHYTYPHEVCPVDRTPMQHLVELTLAGAHERYPQGVPAHVTQLLEHELKLIEELRYAPYFLTVHDLVRFARSRSILCQGRGAAANSAVCYCLGVTSVDPTKINLLFERFVSKERDEPPDIDIDFEHERREEVIQYLYARYGRERAALCAEVVTYRGRSAVREVGKAMGLSLDAVDRLAKNLSWWEGGKLQAEQLREAGFEPDDPLIGQLLARCEEIRGFPRHLSQHVGGFVISDGPLCELVPIENAAMPDRTVICWDKDDIEALGMLKVDVLGLGMLTCIRKCFELIERHHGQALDLATVPAEDPVVYDMCCEADTTGVFQIESRAQRAMLPRLRPRCFYDLVIQVALVRPGPIQGHMVHPYLRRRSGQERVTYPDEKVRRVLEKTLGVPLFQEQAMALAIVAAGFTPGEAEQLRRAIAAWKSKAELSDRFGQRLVEGMLANGYDRRFANLCLKQIKGFSEYGFPESHSASFALLVYVSAWLKRHRPAAFACALLNSQPMGFYAPAQIVRDAKDHGVAVRPIDIHHSQWDCTLEEDIDAPQGPALRLGMRLIKGLAKADAHRLAHAVREQGPFTSIELLWRASSVRVASLCRLAAADAFRSMGLDRQRALWELHNLKDHTLPLFDGAADRDMQVNPNLPELAASRHVGQDYRTTGLSLRAHPLSFLRPRLNAMGVTPAGELQDIDAHPAASPIAVAGLVLTRQRPGTASGLVFITLEDETGVANLMVRPHIFERDRQAAQHAVLLVAHGRITRQGPVVHVEVTRLTDLHRQQALPSQSRDFH